MFIVTSNNTSLPWPPSYTAPAPLNVAVPLIAVPDKVTPVIAPNGLVATVSTYIRTSFAGVVPPIIVPNTFSLSPTL